MDSQGITPTEQRFNDALEKLVRLARTANNRMLLPPTYRDLTFDLMFAGMYHFLLSVEPAGRHVVALESWLAELVLKFDLPRPPSRDKIPTKDGYRDAMARWEEAVERFYGDGLPPPPDRNQFDSTAGYEEARGRWQESVGRIRAMVRQATRTK